MFLGNPSPKFLDPLLVIVVSNESVADPEISEGAGATNMKYKPPLWRPSSYNYFFIGGGGMAPLPPLEPLL